LELDARTAPPDVHLAADVCVVGAGPVGLALADELRSREVVVAVLESGGNGSDPQVRDLDLGERADGCYTDLRDVRARGVGGTATIWNTVLHGVPAAKYVPLDEADFEPRPWVPHSGWPFRRDTLDPWYERAHVICGLDPHRSTEPPDPRGYPLLTFPEGGLRTGVYHYGPASRFTVTLPDGLRVANGVTLVHGATATQLVRERDGRIREVRWRSFGEGAGTVRASTFVLAAGGLENARLLLLDHERRGSDPCDGWLGAGFMEHPIDTSLELVTHAPALVPPEGFYSPAGVGRVANVVGRIALDPELLRAEKLPNASVRLVPIVNPAAMRSSSLRRAARWLVPTSGLRRLVGGTIRRLWRSSAPVVGTRYGVWIDLEQLPSKENRVTLAGERDALGMRRARLAWRWTTADEAHRQRVVAVIERELERAAVGRVRRVGSGPPDPVAHHHMGTTRMHPDPGEGVVDADLRVHGEENLYVVGSSVFPTGGYANPTLTAIALAARLAEHLAAT